MAILEPFKQRLEATRKTLSGVGEAFDLDAMASQIREYEEDMAAPGFWDDMERATRINQQAKRLQDERGALLSLRRRAEDIETLLELAAEDEAGGDELVPEIDAELKKLDTDVDHLYLSTLLTGEYDANNAVLTLHAGAGGTEAQDWASMLYRMYTRWAERSGFALKVLDYLDGDEAGLKSVTFAVNGENAYGYLKAEKGVHRLVRISPFDAAARRHTSFASLDVMPELDNSIHIEINPDDLKMDTYRSSGAGGQHVNKTESAVRITHVPTGIVVSCQTERSQIQNRETCMKMLTARLYMLKEQENKERALGIQGEQKRIEWGSQIRSYVFCPYTMVKDHRTEWETGNVQAVMDGDLDGFIEAYLRMESQQGA